ncbi:hypothetical protein V1264_006653 [Littorina saxatilis]
MTMTSSRLGCFEACSADDTCRSVNVCPSSQTTGQWDCELLDSYSPWFCRRLDTATNPQCFHSEKSSHCQNGGRLRNDGTCKCEPCFMGDDCTQHARDCMEAKEVLAKDGGYDSGAVCLIQPKSALKSFRVSCNFETGTTSLIWRTHNSLGSSPVDWKSYTWNNYKQGMESFDTNNFFVGLENMRLFLAQAEYRVTLWNVYHAPKPQIQKSPSFKTIRLGDETGKFALQYDWYSGGAESSCSTAPNTYESFKGRGVPHPFCTEDNDCGTCAKDKGPGWYYVEGNGVCVGTSPFAPIPQWPQDEGLLTLETTAYPMERIGDFY